MIQTLEISNYALIQSLDLKLEEGFSVITGETGSGKSILLGALGLVLGHRADSSVLFDKDKKCIIEAQFKVKGLERLFKQLDLDFEDVSTFRREIATNGRSRAFVNDTPVQLQDLKLISAQLVDVHSQHETLLLQGSDIQLALVDSFADHAKVMSGYHKSFSEWKALRREIAQHEEYIASNKIDKDYLDFQLNELEQAALKVGEQEEMESAVGLMEHAGEIKSALSETHSGLSDSDKSVLNTLQSIEHQLERLTAHSADIAELASRLKSCRIELDDISEAVLEVDSSLDFEPERMVRLQDRLNELNRLQNKHRVQDTAGLIKVEEEIANKLHLADTAQERSESLYEQLEVLENELAHGAHALRKARLKAIAKLEKKVNSHFPDLALTNARIQISISETLEFNANGKDDISILFCANKGGEFKEIRKVASGGELSRLMLILKSILASKAGLPTLIFDEIDTGVSGEIAGRMADMLKGIADGRQVLAISHLAQVASKADTHYKIAKQDTKERTVTTVSKLSATERITEIAQMLSGAEPGKASIANAKELLKANG